MSEHPQPPTLQDVHAVILVGGLGTRLRSIVADRPKPLAEVAGRPFLAYGLDALAEAGVTRVTFCTGYRGEMVQASFGYRYGRLMLSYSHEDQPLGTAGAVLAALPLISMPTLLVLNGDSLCRADLNEFSAFHHRQGGGVSLALVHLDDTSRSGRVELDSAGRVVRYREKQPNAGPGWINAGMYLIQRQLLDRFSTFPLSFERDVFPMLLSRRSDALGLTIFGWPSDGDFLDIGTPESFVRAGEFVGRGPRETTRR